jgi:tetratricopeptide (TPR) repeat protein
LNSHDAAANRPGIADAYHQLGNTAQERGRLDEADDWYRRALITFEELGDRPGTAITYHNLGMTGRLRGRLEEAEDWYRKSLAIKQDIGNLPGHGAQLCGAGDYCPPARAAG